MNFKIKLKFKIHKNKCILLFIKKMKFIVNLRSFKRNLQSLFRYFLSSKFFLTDCID